MSETKTPSHLNPSKDDFAALLEETFSSDKISEGSVIKGRITAIENDFAIIDVGLKTDGRVPVREFASIGQEPTIEVGDEVEVFLERIENALGEAMLSHDKARREKSWTTLEEKFNNEEHIEGVIFGRVKGGFNVDLNGASAFLPGSQIDIRPMRDVTALMDTPQTFKILKMDRRRGNIVVSRRAILEEARAEDRSKIVSTLAEEQVTEGIVKNLTDYGAFVDLGGVDGLLHVTDIAWRRINHPSEILTIGETIKVQVIKINHETMRISLGMKQLETDPWEDAENKYPLGDKLMGRVTNITDYGAFVELSNGVEGLIHVSEMSWVKKNVHPGKIVSTSQEVEVMILEVDPEKRRISLGLKQCTENPWTSFAEKYPIGTKLSGEIKNITEFGLFVELEHDVDGMVHMSDLDWNLSGEESLAKYKKGDMADVIVLDVDTEKERISLGVKQLESDPLEGVANLKRGDTVTCTVSAITDGGLEVAVGESEFGAFIRRNDLSRDREDQKPERFAIGDKLDAMVTNFDSKARRLGLSIKALEISEEKEAIAQYGSTGAGSLLGDILGAALKTDKKDEKEAEAEEKPKAKKAKKSTKDSAKDKAKDEAKEGAETKEGAEARAKSESDDKAGAKSEESGDGDEPQAQPEAESEDKPQTEAESQPEAEAKPAKKPRKTKAKAKSEAKEADNADEKQAEPAPEAESKPESEAKEDADKE